MKHSTWFNRMVVVQTDDCLIWPFGDSDEWRRPTMTIDGVCRTVAAWALVQTAGAQEGMHALHSCSEPVCFNPRHLRWGTHAENMADKRGMKYRPRMAFTPEQQQEMKDRAAAGETYADIARSFGINHMRVSRIVGVARKPGKPKGYKH